MRVCICQASTFGICLVVWGYFSDQNPQSAIETFTGVNCVEIKPQSGLSILVGLCLNKPPENP